MKDEAIREAVKDHYAAVARGEALACSAPVDEVARSLGYSDEELALAGEANLGLGCGNPLALAEVKLGMTVLDLGSGAGFDALLAWNRVGPTGRVIGVDMTDDMLRLARDNAAKRGAANVEFRKGHIEQLPLDEASVDFVISNCVINLSADKASVFREIARVLRPGGRFAVSDIVLLAELPEEMRRSVSAYVGCLAGASLLGEYVSLALRAGLRQLSIPQIAHGADLVKMLAPGTESASKSGEKKSSCCGSNIQITSLKNPSQMVRESAEAIASIKLHGRK
jgi:SAM-dependent methyltransferase